MSAVIFGLGSHIEQYKLMIQFSDVLIQFADSPEFCRDRIKTENQCQCYIDFFHYFIGVNSWFNSIMFPSGS